MSNDTATGRHGSADAQAPAAVVLHRSVIMAAVATVVLAVTAPLWGPMILGSVNVLPASEQDAIASRQATQTLERSVGALDQRVTAATAAATRGQAEMAGFSRSQTQADASMASLAITELGAALRDPGGFQRQLGLARVAAKSASEFNDLVRQIEPYGETGVPTRQQLLRDFDRMHAAIAPSGAELTAMERLRRLVGRPATDDAAGQGLAEVRTLLREDDFPAAVTAARAIPQPRPQWLNEWLDDAAARVAADALIQRVEKLADGRVRP